REAAANAGRGVAAEGDEGYRDDDDLPSIVREKLDAGFGDSVCISSRLVSSASAHSSYGRFIRFHNSGELNGVFNIDGTRGQHHHQQPVQEQVPVGDYIPELEQHSGYYGNLVHEPGYPHVPVDYAEGYPVHPFNIPGQTINIDKAVAFNRYGYSTMQEFEGNLPPPSAYSRNQDQIKKFVSEMRAARQASTRRKLEADAQRQILKNHQAVLDAAIHIHERQR
ncbi:hypothetical protein GGI12_006334, partial [Dipsacomyces acuminosporus]